MRIVSCAVVIAAALGAQWGVAETVVLSNGQRLEGKVRVQADMVHVQDAAGQIHSVNRALVAAIQSSPARADCVAPSRRTGRSSAANWRQRIEQKLDQPMSVSFESTPIRDVVDFLRTQTGLNFVISPGVPADTTVTLSFTDMSLRNILRWIGETAQVEFAPRDEAILIAPAGSAPGGEEILVLDVRDLMPALIDRPRRPNVLGEAPTGVNASALAMNGAGGAGGIARDSRGRDLADVELQKRGKELVKLLVHTTGPDSWSAQPAYIVPHLADDSD